MNTNKLLTVLFLSTLFFSCDPKIEPTALLGHWQDQKDSTSMLKIDEQYINFVFEGETVSLESYIFYPKSKCPEPCDNACIVTSTIDGKSCYCITEADGKTLAMQSPDAKGAMTYVFNKTGAFEIYDPLLIGDTFYGMLPGDEFDQHPKTLKRASLETGEGSFIVYNIEDAQGNIFGYVIPDPIDNATFRTIVVTSPEAHTEQNIYIGSTYEALKKVLGEFEVHGSEIEGRTTVSKGNQNFVMDVYNSSYELEKTAIPNTSKVKAIELTRRK